MEITRTALGNGKHRYEVDGEIHTKASSKIYPWASVYKYRQLDEWDIQCGRKVGDTIVFLHSREDLAVKGNQQANGLASDGQWIRVPGIFEVTEIA